MSASAWQSILEYDIGFFCRVGNWFFLTNSQPHQECEYNINPTLTTLRSMGVKIGMSTASSKAGWVEPGVVPILPVAWTSNVV